VTLVRGLKIIGKFPLYYMNVMSEILILAFFERANTKFRPSPYDGIKTDIGRRSESCVRLDIGQN
jgi:hypothetical protein